MRGRVKVGGGPVVVEAGAPQRLVRVDVADAADQRLVEQGPFDGGAAAAQRLVEGLVVEQRVEGVAGDVRDDVGQPVGGGVVQRQAAEGALVDEAQLACRSVVGEADPDAQMLLVRCLLRLDQELAAHAEVRQDRLRPCPPAAATDTCRGGSGRRCGGP